MEYSLSLDTFLQFKRKSPFEVAQSWLILKRENTVKHSHLDTKQIQGWWTVDSGQSNQCLHVGDSARCEPRTATLLVAMATDGRSLIKSPPTLVKRPRVGGMTSHRHPQSDLPHLPTFHLLTSTAFCCFYYFHYALCAIRQMRGNDVFVTKIIR